MPIIPIFGSSSASPYGQNLSKKEVLEKAKGYADQLKNETQKMNDQFGKLDALQMQMQGLEEKYADHQISKEAFQEQMKKLTGEQTQLQQKLSEEFQSFQQTYDQFKALYDTYQGDFSQTAQGLIADFIEQTGQFVQNFSPFGGPELTTDTGIMFEELLNIGSYL